MGAEKIAAFYDDEIKLACDRASTDKAFYLRSLSTASGLAWRARRLSRFVAGWGSGALRPAAAAAALVIHLITLR